MIVVIFFMDGSIKNNFTPSWRKNVAFQHFDQLHCVVSTKVLVYLESTS